MKSVFADTFYFLALLNERDAAHARAVAASRIAGLALVTTEFVLIELADALCKRQQRDEVLALCNVVETDPAFTLIRATTELIQRAENFTVTARIRNGRSLIAFRSSLCATAEFRKP